MWEKIKNWLSSSNHPYHIAGGVIQSLVIILISKFYDLAIWPSILLIDTQVFISMVMVELKDMQCGNKFDWSDILAGLLFPILCTVIGIIAILLSPLF